ncbi:hypothetical protein B0O80DRAFT_451953 [Mortierella sp. GBAus27b]|nr:hypothetical protein BGX31_005475 [Mortierella sp. GBA43]KAI8353390.1 hypothetical protein B0O80DRAFT_451953 [Mortierella sp. GBAus27b]
MPNSHRSTDSIPRTATTANTTCTSLPHSGVSSHYASTPSFSHPLQEDPTFKVIIVGAGIGGLMMGYCLERAGIDYVILERQQRSQVSKSTIQLSSNTLYALEQLGLLDQIMAVAKPVAGMTLRKQNLSIMGKVDVRYFKDRHGFYTYTVQRTEFCEILASNMKQERIKWGQYVLEIVSGDAGVQCRCANGHVEQGDILVGADGAHSAVRQNLYKNLKEKGLLPKCDMDDLKVTQNSIIGLTRPVDLTRFPDAGAEFAEVHIISGREACPFTLWISPTSGNRINWSVSGPLLTNNKAEDSFMLSHFGPEEIAKTCRLISGLEIPYGGTLGDLIEITSEDCMTKMLVEERYYKTWFHGRTVLIGEACHKYVSYSGQGAEQAMIDAICLVNLFYRIKSPYLLKDITTAFESYFELRLPETKAAINASAQTANLIHGQGLAADMMRKIVFNLPAWIQASSVDKMQVRPMLDFLPVIPDRGSKPAPRPASVKSAVSR